ncbi:uncharacterized protein VP01_588g3 [Puccinia sorghi]|uniref:Uncharacterized protein n=1 Tax=Puccinia sorghi TaxID=27349 RepID=A0A0L6UIL5_9BASI|nr:uncharacterized protein VP01_588g3 [Puccinia sorghi]
MNSGRNRRRRQKKSSKFNPSEKSQKILQFSNPCQTLPKIPRFVRISPPRSRAMFRRCRTMTQTKTVYFEKFTNMKSWINKPPIFFFSSASSQKFLPHFFPPNNKTPIFLAYSNFHFQVLELKDPLLFPFPIRWNS